MFPNYHARSEESNIPTLCRQNLSIHRKPLSVLVYTFSYIYSCSSLNIKGRAPALPTASSTFPLSAKYCLPSALHVTLIKIVLKFVKEFAIHLQSKPNQGPCTSYKLLRQNWSCQENAESWRSLDLAKLKQNARLCHKGAGRSCQQIGRARSIARCDRPDSTFSPKSIPLARGIGRPSLWTDHLTRPSVVFDAACGHAYRLDLCDHLYLYDHLCPSDCLFRKIPWPSWTYAV